MGKLTIGQVAAETRLRASIRYYEAEGLIPAARRRRGRRVYDRTVLDRLSLIELAKRSGFIAEIRHLLSGFSRRTPVARRWRLLADAKIVELDRRLAQIRTMKQVLEAVSQCDCPTLEVCGHVIREASRSSPDACPWSPEAPSSGNQNSD